MKTIAIAGLGNMGQAIFDTLSATKLYTVSGFGRNEDVNKALSENEVVILGMKPQDFGAFADAVKTDLSEKLIISIMAGVSAKTISEKLGASKVVRTIPNLALKRGLSFTVWFSGEAVADEDKKFVKEILQLMGEEMEVSVESDIDKITALSGCGPAYFYYLTEILEKAAEGYGLTKELAEKLARTTFLGAAKYLETEDCSAKELRMRVSSKGGCTEAATKHLDEKHVPEDFLEAFEKAVKRAGELSN